MDLYIIQEKLDRKNCDNEKGVNSNGTVKVDAEDGAIHIDDVVEINGYQCTGREHIEEHKDPWINMFKNNRVANNGMNLSYLHPQIVDGQTIVQLEEKEVQLEEHKWNLQELHM